VEKVSWPNAVAPVLKFIERCRHCMKQNAERMAVVVRTPGDHVQRFVATL
jgi:hypothetical protein